jgi:glycine cleavage system regulatory protein
MDHRVKPGDDVERRTPDDSVIVGRRLRGTEMTGGPPAMASLILTVIGPDRPGLVRALAQSVAAHGGSWLESRMARLGGQFAGIVLVEAPDSLLEDLRALENQGLRIVVQTASVGEASAAPQTGERLALEVVGNDRPGIVRDVARVLAEHGVNIEELTTGVVSGSFSGETLFRATALVRAPDAASVAAIRAGLEFLGNEMMVDIQPAGDAASPR